MKKLFLLCMVMVMVVSMTACGGNKNIKENKKDTVVADGEKTEKTADTEYKTCLISEAPAGVPFTDLTWKGFEKIKEEYGVEVKLIEALDKAEYEEQVRAMAEMGYSPIYTMFDTINEVVLKVAGEYPDTKFCVIDSSLDVTKQNNVANVYVDALEPSFIAGYVASQMTKTNTIAWIGSLDIPVINRFGNAFLAGVKYGNPEVEVLRAYIGDDSDAVKANETTKIVLDQDADIVFQTANLAGLGVIQACGEAGVKCIGVDEWQGDVDPCVFWSSLTDINGAVFDSFTKFKEGDFQQGLTNYGVATQSAIYDERDYEKLPEEVKAGLDKLMDQIKNQTIDLEALLP